MFVLEKAEGKKPVNYPSEHLETEIIYCQWNKVERKNPKYIIKMLS